MKKRVILMNIMLLGFLLGVYKGKIAIWKDNDPTPIKVFPYKASMLPKADQKALEKGIKFDNLDQLQKMVQDYLS